MNPPAMDTVDNFKRTSLMRTNVFRLSISNLDCPAANGKTRSMLRPILNQRLPILRNGKVFLLLLLALCVSACSTIAGKETTGVIIARRAQVRSSIAVVAADLSEVLRGDVVDILDSATAENGERWLHVRAHDAERT
jgi:hypothetical protein